MKELTNLLDAWRSAKVTPVPVPTLATDAALQSRASECLPPGAVSANTKQRATHVQTMTAQLGDKRAELEPVLLWKRNNELVMFDGHHRLSAYRKAGRPTIPARLLDADRDTIVQASKLVNVGGEKLGLHPEQRRDAAWQLMAHLTERGRLPLPVSQRALAAHMGLSVGNVNTMTKKLPTIDPRTFDRHELDPATGWPRWCYARRDRELRIEPPATAALWHARAHKLAASLADAMYKDGPDILREALGLLRDHEADPDAIADAEAYLQEIDPDPDY